MLLCLISIGTWFGKFRMVISFTHQVPSTYTTHDEELDPSQVVEMLVSKIAAAVIVFNKLSYFRKKKGGNRVRIGYKKEKSVIILIFYTGLELHMKKIFRIS